MDDNDRKYNIYLVEEFYCHQMEVLVEEERFDDAHAIFEEFVVDSQEPEEWTFIPYFDNVH